MIEKILTDPSAKPAEKKQNLADWLSKNPKKLGELISFAKASKDPQKATCIEAIEEVTKKSPQIADEACFDFLTETLTAKAPRLKWEAAKTIGNIAPLFPARLNTALANLLVNSESDGTVVRWATAYALGEIVKMKTTKNKTLVPAIEAIVKREEKNSIRKIYAAALKKIAAK